MVVESQSAQIEKLAGKLEAVNQRVEELLKKIPTSDPRLLGELHSLVEKQRRLIDTRVGKERGTMLLERAVRRAHFLRKEYANARSGDQLRKDNH